MPYYRLHILDGDGGVIGAVEFESANDEEATERAGAVLGDVQRGEL